MKHLAKIRNVVAGAAILVVAGSLFIQRAQEWQKGLAGEFIVYGQQTGGSPGSTGGTGTGVPAGFSRAIPEVVVGGSSTGVVFSTSIQVVNAGMESATVSGSFFNEDGTPWGGGILTSVNITTASTFGGNFGRTVPPNNILLINLSAPPADPVNPNPFVGWGQINSSVPVTINTFITLRGDAASGSPLLSRIGIAPTATDMQRFVIPRSSMVTTGQGSLITQQPTRDVALALVNTGATPGVLNATLINAAGLTLAARSLVMGPHTHRILFARDLFNLNEPPGAGFTFIEFESFSPQWAAAALSLEGSVAASVVVDKIE